ncbi:hypothetical protein J0X15_14580 [Roseibium sp. CAU 1637]|uniref:Transmembrane protein n=1 Tax=Roseibium limicola TaxID=2816037 RepID=A0A939ER66_9HYPH|nr:hypothetical protein [Roseibium limicola]MBO0346456.1 hypothetical protein [Roseibium limicola]
MTFYVEIIRHTPSGVWLLLVYCLYAAISQLRVRQVRPLTVLIVPAIFGCLAVARGLQGSHAPIFWLGCFTGLVLAWSALLMTRPVSQHLRNGRLQTGRDFFAALLIPMTFIGHYITGVLQALEPGALLTSQAQFMMAVLITLPATYMGTRAAGYLRNKAQSVVRTDAIEPAVS